MSVVAPGGSLTPDAAFAPEPAPAAPALGHWRRVGARLADDRFTCAVLALLALIVLSAVLAPWISPYDPSAGDALARLKPIGTPGHILGTDETGRDMLTRLLWGGRLSLISGAVPVAVALVAGGALGLLAGTLGGAARGAIMRVMDVFYAFPAVLLAVALAGALGGGLPNTIVALSAVFVPSIARVADAAAAQAAASDYARWARMTGASLPLLMGTQILPNALGPVLVYACSLVSTGVLLGAGLSFLGLGVQPPEPEWGLMLNALRQAIYVDWTLAVLPGAFILVTSLCLNLACDGLRDALDVRLAKR